MKIKVLLTALIFTSGIFGAQAQKGVDSGTQYGRGEDSIRCITALSLYQPYAKSGNFADAIGPWTTAYEECPAANKDLYLNGVKIVNWEIENEKDPAKREALVEKLMGVYDKRIKYFGNDNKYGKDWILSRKANDYLRVKGDGADPAVIYGWLKEAIDEFGDQTESMAVSLYMFASHRLLIADSNNKEQYLNDYFRSTAILDAQIAAAQAANNEKDLNALTTYKTAVDGGFISSGAADCETLQSMYADKVEENKEDMEFLGETLALLKRMRCTDTDVYIAASRYVHLNNPTAESAVGLGKQAIRDKDYEQAIKYFEEAVTLETDNDSKADDYYTIAALMYDQNNYSRARQYALKTLELKPNYGQAYMLIGNMYGTTIKNIYPNDQVLMKVAYNIAIDKFEKARQVDPSVAEDANRFINAYRAQLPSTEDIFMHPDIEKGKPFTVGGWINERTTVR